MHEIKIKKIKLEEEIRNKQKIKDSICIIEGKNGKSSGFFIEIPYFDESKKFLFTNSDTISQNMINLHANVSIEYQEGIEKRQIQLLDDKRKIFAFDKIEENIIAIEIINSDNISDNLFLKADTDYILKGFNSYLNMNFITFELQEENKTKIIIKDGMISNINKEKDYFFNHNVNMNQKSQGTAIILNNLKVIGINCGKDDYINENYGIFIGKIIDKINIKTLVDENGNAYIGGWKNGQKEGKGTEIYSNGDKYIGMWENDKKEGKGCYFYSNGDKYDGEWRNGSREGQGTEIYIDGDAYVGEWKKGKKDGQGTYAYKNGDKYIGEWKNGKKEGHGIFIYSNGVKFIGEWKNGKKEGNGKEIYKDGIESEGIWKNDEKIENCSIF